MSRNSRIISLVYGLACAVTLLTPFLGNADETPYVLLAPLTASQEGQAVVASNYIPDLFRLGIGIASGLAVLAIVYSGIKYMLSDVVTTKADAISGIKNALLGLLLAIAAYLILKTINPNLVTLNFILQ